MMRVVDKIKREQTLTRFGFGAEAMQSFTVCATCSSLEASGRMVCSKCGTTLPRVTLYDYYRAKHEICAHCGNVLSKSMNYCPKCGMEIKKA